MKKNISIEDYLYMEVIGKPFVEEFNNKMLQLGVGVFKRRNIYDEMLENADNDFNQKIAEYKYKIYNINTIKKEVIMLYLRKEWDGKNFLKTDKEMSKELSKTLDEKIKVKRDLFLGKITYKIKNKEGFFTILKRKTIEDYVDNNLKKDVEKYLKELFYKSFLDIDFIEGQKNYKTL